LEEKQQEIKRLHTQLSSWRDKCLKLENELKDKHNKKRQFSIPVASSEIDPKLPNQTTAFKMIKELEDQVTEAHRQMNYEVEKRDSDINQLTDTINNLIAENKLINSENETMRVQLEKIFTQRLTPNQISEEKEKQRELLLSSLMAKLEKSRSREQALTEKVSILEKENIELKYIKEGIDTRIEALNRKNRELESSKKPYQ
jgi:chromosome segregation ATPase